MKSLLNKVEKIIQDALIHEVTTTPKPGLVDLKDNGAHTDMTPELFITSAKAISPYLRKMFEAGYTTEEMPQEIFHRIQKIGIEAERAMFQATNGVNTHKGAIFNLGILSASAGICYRKYHTFELTKILKLSQQMTEDDMRIFFQKLDQRAPQTHGEILYKKYGEKGIRGEVSNGFPIIKDISYPAICKEMEVQRETNTVYVHVLLQIIGTLVDTNILSRSHGNYAEAEWMREMAKCSLSKGGMLTEAGREYIEKWNTECIEKNLSPGGAADLLASTIFLYRLLGIKEN